VPANTPRNDAERPGSHRTQLTRGPLNVIASSCEAIQGHEKELVRVVARAPRDDAERPGGRRTRFARGPFNVIASSCEAIQGHEKELDRVVARAPRDDAERLGGVARDWCADLSTSLRALAKQSRATKKSWIASSQALLAMTVVTVATATGRRNLSQRAQLQTPLGKPACKIHKLLHMLWRGRKG
jgi:hypothetical protein